MLLCVKFAKWVLWEHATANLHAQKLSERVQQAFGQVGVAVACFHMCSSLLDHTHKPLGDLSSSPWDLLQHDSQ